MWKIGDRVEYRKPKEAPGANLLNGMRGTVVWIDDTEAGVTVKFDKYVPDAVIETRGGNRIKNCWFCRPDSLTKVLRGAAARKAVFAPVAVPVAVSAPAPALVQIGCAMPVWLL